MTEFFESVEKAAPMLLRALHEARAKGEETEDFPRRLSSLRCLHELPSLMRAYGKTDSARHESVTQLLPKEDEPK